ncbi:MAG: hypothetical protein ABIK92_21280 [Pseudomonadota bacterium]
MQKSEKTYRRLPGKRKRIIGVDTLWAGPDHMLSIESSGVSESYRRFYYNDIKSIVIAKTLKATIESIVIGLVIIILTAFAIQLSGSFSSSAPTADAMKAPFAIVLWIIDSILLIYFIKNMIHGSSCECWIETDVQREKLVSVNRLRAAKKFITTLKPLIEKEQGVLPIETLQNFNRFQHSDKDKLFCDNQNKRAEPLSTKSKYLFIMLYVLITITGLFCIITLYNRYVFTIVTETLMLFGICILSIIAVVKQSGSTINKPLKIINWSALGLVIILFGCGYIEYFWLIFKNTNKPNLIYDNWQLFEVYAKINPFEYPLMLGMAVFNIASFLTIGLSGLILSRKQV